MVHVSHFFYATMGYIMNCWPVVIREIRTESRRPFNFWLRLLGVGAITLVLVVSLLNQSGSAANPGARLFGNLNATLFVAIRVLAPVMTADCISEEKRALGVSTQLSGKNVDRWRRWYR
jgi:hypothetical protein